MSLLNLTYTRIRQEIRIAAEKERQGVTILGLCGGKQMNSADRMVMIAARSQGILIDFVLVSLVRWGLKALGLHYVYYQPVLRGASPPLTLADLAHPASALFYGGMYFRFRACRSSFSRECGAATPLLPYRFSARRSECATRAPS